MVKILGFEINRSQKHAISTIKVPSNLQATKPSIAINKAFPRQELGDSGTRMLHGIVVDDYNPNLQGVQAIKVYDEMRKGDGTVRAAMMVTSLPIRRAKWFVDPVDATNAQDVEVADFVRRALFEWMDISWDDVIRQALLMLPFGVMVFEKVYGIKDFEGKSYVIISKLAPRLPKSIQQWELSDGTFGIKQIRQDGVLAEIPGSKLLIFVNEKEGDNWWGTSFLRAAYKHWYHKNNFYQIDAIAFERQGLGVPMITMPAGYTSSDEQKAITAASNLRSNENGYIIVPPGYKAEFMNMGASSTRDPQNSINHHNKEILQSVLAQFLELGSTATGGGSRALSQDHSELFFKAMEAVANTITSEVNKNLIPELVDMNFNNIEAYPKLNFAGISQIDVVALATAYGGLVTANGITPTNNDEKYLRSLMGLPEITDEEMDEVDAEPDLTDPNDPSENEPAGPNAKKPITVEVKDVPPAKTDTSKKDNKQVDTATSNVKKKASVHVRNVRSFDDGAGFMSWRKLTFTEQKVSFQNIEDKMNALQDKFTADAMALLNDAKDSFIAKLQTALDNGDTKAVSDLELKFVNAYKKLLKDYMKQAYEYGKSNASTEMGVGTPPNSADTLASIDLLADTIANKAASDLEAKAKISTVNGLKKLSIIPKAEKYASIIQVVGAIDSVLEATTGSIVDAAAGLIISQAMNMGRKDVFDRNPDQIYALQRSEILDETTCDFCLSMDGRIVDLNDEWASEDCFHTNCRGIWVEIMKEEPNPPEIDGVPNNVGDYYGGEPNALVQPPKPIVRPDSPAAEEVARRQADKKKK